MEIKSPPENNPYYIWIQGQIDHLVSPLYPNKANKPGYGQLYIFYFFEETTKQHEIQSNVGGMSEVMQ
jgi:hypothetical protein